MREHWLKTKQLGRARFIRGEVLYSLVFWLIVMVGIDVIPDRPTYWTLRSAVLADLIMLPIFLLGGYLEGRWKWTDLEKKYPDDGLPPWE